MITHGIVITDRDLPVFNKIINKAVEEKEAICNWYCNEYGIEIEKLHKVSSEFTKAHDNPKLNQTVVDLSLYSQRVYKMIIYRYLKSNAGQISKVEMDSITSMLERLDWWVDDYLKADEGYIESNIIYKD